MTRKITVAGSLAQRPRRAGHAWVFLQYLLGFRRLGWDVLFVDETADDVGPDDPRVAYLADVMQVVGLGDSWSILTPSGSVGRTRDDVLAHAGESAFLLNVMGFLQDAAVRDRAQRRVFLDIDPGFPQMWRALGLADVFAGHDDFVTVGANVGGEGSLVPTCGLDWITTLPPVVLEWWPVADEPDGGPSGGPVDGPLGGPVTSVCTWRGPFGPIEFEGRTFGLRVHEFRRFVDLPARTGLPFELALDIDPGDEADRRNLLDHGFTLVDPVAVAGGLLDYRHHVQRSGAELCIAKNLYVQSRGGWFSDRSACYLASGRPVLCQDTGLAGVLPTGEGLLLFSTPDEAVTAVESLSSEATRHRAAARRLAVECFDSDLVLARLLGRLGVGA